MEVSPATADDLSGLHDLRNHYVAHSSATFDEQPLTRPAIEAWLRQFSISGPYRLLVARRGGRVLGFCSSQPYRSHPAFARTIETSIYVSPDAGRSGVGSALYGALFAALADQPLHRALVGIALPNEASVRLHRKFEYREVGVFNEYACKNGRLISSLWMERAL